MRFTGWMGTTCPAVLRWAAIGEEDLMRLRRCDAEGLLVFLAVLWAVAMIWKG